MNKQVYKKTDRKKLKKRIRILGLVTSVSGLLIGLYVFFPILSWELYLSPAFASNTYASPIPKATIIDTNSFGSLIKTTATVLTGNGYSNGSNWLPETSTDTPAKVKNSSFYYLSIPEINIENAIVSTIDLKLTEHLVHFPGTASPADKGTAVIFGHSTLPQLYDPKNYKTIFANAHKLERDDEINVTYDNTFYTYRIFDVVVVEAEDTSYLTQSYDDSYITIVTCTPPGTIWKRLIIKARIVK